ncbi:PepSY domain-containing protein [Arthrobacter sp. ok362]|jgi:hypothetical protein|uniref:PepSY domain-containing protein n=1 Tax=Arthrobacter sp. ok362 TaxID=1761745 RepID=UPI000880241E|nr:PepSY domain-containing protein [Arthrobacter sp. ok362]SDM04855.1 Peptidase propeptide and YPEB domain-containing protein [Arthrobacter sp. ok362]
MRKRTMWITGAASAAVLLGGASVAVAASQQVRVLQSWNPAAAVLSAGDLELDGESDGPALTDADRAMASSAALAKVGQGSVTKVERDDDGAAYEVKVRLSNGTQVEVALGTDFQVLSQSGPEHDD